MLTLYSYPDCSASPTTTPYGLKVFAVLVALQRAVPPRAHSRRFVAPRGQLPFIADAGETIGDSDTIIAHLIRKYRLTIDEGLTLASATSII